MGANAELVKLMGPQLELVLPVLDEKSRRLVLAAVARAAGDGGITAVAKATGASWQTVADGVAELESGQVAPPGRVRRPGAGRPGWPGAIQGWCRRCWPWWRTRPGGTRSRCCCGRR